MHTAGLVSRAAGRRLITFAIAFGLVALAGSVAIAQAQAAKVLIYTGTTGFRHADAIENGVGPIQNALDDAGVEYDREDCNGNGGDEGNCDHPEQNPRIFTSENLAQYDAIFLLNASDSWAGGGLPGPLWDSEQRAAIQEFVNDGGGIAANHNAVDMGAGVETWDWWDGGEGSAVGTLMAGHARTDLGNVATVEVSDRNHPSTADLPDSYGFGGEHYSFERNVRGEAHVLATLDEESYDGDGAHQAMGADHPISWCKPYEGGRVWVTAMGHFGASYTENGGDNELVDHILGGIRWAAGDAGAEGDCGGTIWSNFERTVLATDLAVGPIGLDVDDDGRVYWTEIGPVGLESEGRLRMWDPETEQDTLVGEIETRADHGNLSEDGVLGMALAPDFEQSRHVFIYYSPRQVGPDGPEGLVVGHNLISRFTLNEDGTEIVDEQPILEVPKVKVGEDGDGIPGQGSSNHPGHVGGAGLSFDSEGNLYLGVGDDVNPFGEGQSGYSPLDQRYEERYDARNTAANTSDLRGKILRITPLADASGDPGEGSTYEIPDGNMFTPGTEGTRPEIYAMGFRNPFTVQADPANPGTVVVADYGPDSGQSNPDRGPAGIIEWNHITEPGFYGWPFCTGDNAEERSYNRFEFPDGPSGERFDCSAGSIPNESPNNPGLGEIPGPAVPADVWHSRDGSHPDRFGLPSQGAPQEPVTGPIYRFDPDNPSDTKWPAYYDGSWPILDRSQNWWREARLTDDGSGLLTVNGFLQPGQFGEPEHEFPIPIRFGPDGSLYMALWTGGCCRDLSGEPAELMRIDYVAEEGDDGGEPELKVTGAPRRRTVGPRQRQTVFRLRAKNIGDADTGTVRLCATGPPKRVKVRGPRCVTRNNIAPGQRRIRAVRVRIRPAARGTTSPIRLIGKGPNVEKQRTAVRLRVRR